MEVALDKTFPAIAAAVLVILSLYLLLRGKKRVGTPVPVVPGYPIIGNMLDVLPHKSIATAERVSKQFGPFAEFTAFHRRAISIYDVALCKEILSKRPKVFRRLDYSAEALGMSTSLLHTFGNKWSRIRKATAPSVSKRHIANNLHSLVKESSDLIERLNSKADGKTEVSIKDELFQYTLRLICRLAFGLRNPSKEFTNYFLAGDAFSRDLFTIFNFMMQSAVFPFPQWFNSIPPFARVEKEALEANGRWTHLCKQIIDEKRRELVDNPNAANRFSVIDILLDKENQPTDVEGGEITDAEIVANVKIFFIAGSDTTSIVLTWAVYYLWMAENKDILDEVRAEADRFFAAYNEDLTGDEVLNLISKESMPLSTAVTKETLRLRGPVPMISVEVESNTESHVLSNGIVLGPQERVTCVVEICHLNEKVFPNPKSFLPKRWLTSDSRQLEAMEGSFLPFGSGPRVCPGMGLGMNEAVIGLAALVHHLDFQLACPASEIQRHFAFVAQPNKMPVYVVKRQR